MARYDVYRNPEGAGYLLDVQSDLLQVLSTRVVVPLLPEDAAPMPAKRLNPVFVINDDTFVLLPQFIATLPASAVGNSVGTLKEHFAEITDALDMVFQGF